MDGDEEMAAEMPKRTIQKIGCNVIATSSSMAALELCRKDPSAFELVVTDQTMPQLTGDQLAAQLSKPRPNLPVIICSGYSSKCESPETC